MLYYPNQCEKEELFVPPDKGGGMEIIMEQDRQTSNPYWERPGQSGNGTFMPHHHQPQTPANGLARASMVLGIMALLSFFTFTVYPAVILGSLSIILALLSRGASLKMHEKAKNGVLLSSVAIGCNIAVIALVCAVLFGMPDIFERIYGMSYQEMVEGMENGTLDYDDIYNNVYDNIYNDIYEKME